MKTKSVMRTLAIVFGAVGLVMAAGAVVFLSLGGRMWIGAVPFGVNAIVFLGIAAGFGISEGVKRRRREELISRGEAITAQVVSLEPNAAVSVNGRHPVRLVCKYVENGTTYICRSEDISGMPELISDTVTVYRDPYDIKRYYVDAQSVLKATVEL